MQIAILGAGSYVSRAILPHLLRREGCRVLLYTRAPDRLSDWTVERRLPADRISIQASKDFGDRDCDAVINLVGVGDPHLVDRMAESILPLTVEWDERVLQVLKKRPSTRYIFASSGVATGHDFKTPRAPDTPFTRPPCNDFYARAKADAEIRHREARDLSIVDLRLYNFYSADMGAELGYLVCSIMKMLLTRSTLITDQHDIARDYVHPSDLSSAIMAILGSPPVNAAYDVRSVNPARKFEMLRRFQVQFALQWQIRPSSGAPNKMNYYSEDLSLRNCGFTPAFSALEAVIDQATAFLARSGGMPQVGRV